MRMIRGLLLVCIMISMFAAAGCTNGEETTPAATGTPAVTATPSPSPGPVFEKNIIEFEKRYTPEGTCYWETRIELVNTGTGAATNVKVLVSLVNEDSGATADSESELFTRFNAGESKSFVKRLNGECDQGYRVEIAIDSD
ncbi:MAG: hypothetical protein APR53_09185 [Methanoculleus sp. SDB]|nr:MAG: hypothetical protein APR53_09185 [Methanoculleus sp. SDB]